MSQGIDADDAIPFAPGVSPPVYPLSDASGQASARSATSGILGACVFLLADDGVGCAFVYIVRSSRVNQQTKHTQAIKMLLLQLYTK
jgi:hypothetical protein